MKVIFDLIDKTERIHGDDTAHIQLYTDWSGGFYAHDKFIFDFNSKKELVEMLKSYIKENTLEND